MCTYCVLTNAINATLECLINSMAATRNVYVQCTLYAKVLDSNFSSRCIALCIFRLFFSYSNWNHPLEIPQAHEVFIESGAFTHKHHLIAENIRWFFVRMKFHSVLGKAENYLIERSGREKSYACRVRSHRNTTYSTAKFLRWIFLPFDEFILLLLLLLYRIVCLPRYLGVHF